MAKDEVDKLHKTYTIPSNCEYLAAPSLNPELKAILSAANIARDNAHMTYQSKLGKGVSAIGKALNQVLEKEENIPRKTKDNLLPNLVDASKMLTSLFYDISQTRRQMIAPALNKNIKEMTENIPPGRLLFGDELSEKIKEQKALERAGKDLRQQANYSVFRKRRGGGGGDRTPATPNATNQLNLKRPAHSRGAVRPARGQPSRIQKYQYTRRR